MKKINIFCFGFGQVAKNFINRIKLEKININLSASSREKSQKKIFNEIRYDSYQFSENTFDKAIIEKLKKSDHILVSISPVNGVDIVAKNFLKIFKNIEPKWITYLSATSVYGDHKGKWVDEKSETIPTSPMGIDRLKAETSWLNLAKNKNLPLQIFRLSGIYSNEKNILIRLKSGDERIINISDDKPASSAEVALYGSNLLNIKNPETIELSSIKNEILKNFYKDSKKVSNKKMKIFFNYNLKYSSYAEGLNYIYNNII